MHVTRSVCWGRRCQGKNPAQRCVLVLQHTPASSWQAAGDGAAAWLCGTTAGTSMCQSTPAMQGKDGATPPSDSRDKQKDPMNEWLDRQTHTNSTTSLGGVCEAKMKVRAPQGPPWRVHHLQNPCDGPQTSRLHRDTECSQAEFFRQFC